MSEPDHRSFRIALVADRYINPGPGGFDAIPVLLEREWGVLHLPSDRYSTSTAGLLLEQVAEQAEEFHRHGYQLVVIGKRPGLARALKAAGVPPLHQIEPKSATELRRLLGKSRTGPLRPGPVSRPRRTSG